MLFSMNAVVAKHAEATLLLGVEMINLTPNHIGFSDST